MCTQILSLILIYLDAEYLKLHKDPQSRVDLGAVYLKLLKDRSLSRSLILIYLDAEYLKLLKDPQSRVDLGAVYLKLLKDRSLVPDLGNFSQTAQKIETWNVSLILLPNG